MFLKQTVVAASMSALDATERALEDEQMGFHVDTTPQCQVSHAELSSHDLHVHGMGWVNAEADVRLLAWPCSCWASCLRFYQEPGKGNFICTTACGSTETSKGRV